MLKIQNLEHETTATIVFQRLSVVVTDLFFIWSLYKYSLSPYNSDHQILPNITSNSKGLCKDYDSVSNILPRLPLPRSRSFPIQRTTLLDLSILSPRSSDKPSPIRIPLHHALVFQAYIPLPRAGILLLSTAIVLFQPVLASTVPEYCKIRCRGAGNSGSGIRTLRCTGTNSKPCGETISVPERPLSCVLGTQFLGVVLFPRSYRNT